MATFTRPTYSEILTRVQADIDSRLPGADSTLRRSILNTLSYVLAGVAHGLYGFISWIALQVFPDTAELEFLNRWSAVYGVNRIAASKATGTVNFTGTNGAVIPSGSELRRSDGIIFTTNASVTISAGAASAVVTCGTLGLTGNTAGSSILNFVSPLAGVDSNAVTAVAGLNGGADAEDDTALRARLLDRIQSPPHGGSKKDYEKWALEVPGVSRVWVYPMELGLGAVTVRFMMDDVYPDGVPQSADVLNVQAHIDSVRPVTADVTVVAPVSAPLDFSIELVVADSPEIRAAVEENLRDMIRRDATPGGTIYLSRINENISAADGEFAHILVDPVADVTHSTGTIATFGTITWI